MVINWDKISSSMKKWPLLLNRKNILKWRFPLKQHDLNHQVQRQALGLMQKPLVMLLTSHFRIPDSSFLLMHTLGGSNDGASDWVPAIHVEDLDWGFWIPALAQSQPSQTIRGEPTDESSLSFSPSRYV